MLVLSRRENQSIVLPGLDIKVWVVAIEGCRVKLGFEAPGDVKILRAELLGDYAKVSGESALGEGYP